MSVCVVFGGMQPEEPSEGIAGITAASEGDTISDCGDDASSIGGSAAGSEEA